MSYTKEQLRDIFRKPFNAEVWKNILLDFFQAKEIRTTPQDLELENTSDKGFYLGKNTTSEGLALGFFLFEINSGDVLRKRVGLRNLLKPFLKYDVDAAIAVFNDNKHWRLSFITDFGSNKTAPKRFTYVFGDSAQYYNTPVKRLFDLQSKDISVKNLYDTFSVEALTKEFYNELANWYAWATKVIQFPNALEDASDDQKYNAESGIRLVTRLIFIWFLKEKKLVPEDFFDTRKVSKLLKDFDPSKKAGLFDQYVLDSKYYQAILQNLFFAMLNCPIMEDGTSLRGFRKYDEDGKATATGRGDSRLMRYKDYFADPDAFLQLAQKVPFLNGGLFDCLDDPDNKFYLDGFSDNKEIRKTLCVPDFLFFGENNDIDLSEWFDDRQKKHINVRGIIDILKSYQFTIEENTPYEQEVALDPELLGKVFENLLASYNPETKTTARKSTGSYYTPREIVQYMVNESLVAYLKEQVDESLEQQYRQLLDYNDTEGQISLSLEQKKSIMSALYHCKVLDPACGSGAFPMGILQQMVHVLSKLDADNTIWKNVIETKLGQELASTIGHTDEERRELQNDINRNFDLSQNAPDYARKLYLIENCIYGIDIQTIAIQISKLRCFISLVVDQKVNDSPEDNYGIRPLPNLEARFVAANSLIGLRNDLSLANTEAVQKVREELADANHRIFNAKTLKTKRKWRSKVKDLRDTLVEELKQTGFVTDDDASLIASWDPFNQNCSSCFFDPEWMFGFKKFDIVIGNPPYLRIQGIREANPKFADYLSAHYLSATGSFDLYVTFVERGLNLISPNGIVNYIMPTKWTNSAFGKGLRKIVSKSKSASKIINFGAYQVFNASTYTGLQWFTPNNQFLKYFELDRDLSSNEELKRYLDSLNDEQVTNIDSNKLAESQWVLTNNTVAEVLNRLDQHPRRIKDVFDRIFCGLQTSKDDVYFIYDCIVDEKYIVGESKQLGRKVQIEKGLVKPLLKGEDVHRYDTIKTDRYVVFPYKIQSGKALLYQESELSELYPCGYAYLKECEEILRDREHGRLKNDEYWFRYIYPKNLVLFDNEKLVAPDISMGGNFAYDCQGEFYQTTTIYGYIKKQNVPESYKFWMALLNSRLFWWFLVNTGTVLANGFFRFKPDYVNPFPVPQAISKETEQSITILVDYILTIKSLPNDFVVDEYVDKDTIIRQFERVIDALIYELYFPNEFMQANISFADIVPSTLAPVKSNDINEAVITINKSFELLSDMNNEIRNNLKYMSVKLETLLAPIINV